MIEKKAAALKYDSTKNNAPNLVAKGDRYIAEQIIDVAQKNNIPIKEDKDMIEILSKIEINQEIPNELYKAVAEVFSFVYKVSKENKIPKDSSETKTK